MKQIIISFAIISMCFSSAMAQNPSAYNDETQAQKAERMAWFEDARFGMFIHWGAYSLLDGEYNGKVQKDPKGEWIMRNLRIPVAEYKKEVASKFNPQNFDADAWVKMAKNAGMKYLVMTTKHHDGFALFNSETSDYNIIDTANYEQDIIKALAKACKKYGLRFGVYYSQAQDWYHPGGFKPDSQWDEAQNGSYDDYFNNIVKGQVTELFTDYGDISLIWWDSARAVQNEDLANSVGKELVQLQPDIIVNSRLSPSAPGDFNSYEQVIPGVLHKEYNELCLTHNRSWSYRASDKEWKSPEFILKTLVHMASIGGNLLFNVGPDATGAFPPEAVETLDYVSEWMAVNSKSIYNTEANPFYKLDFGSATVLTENDMTTLFLQVSEWPENGELTVEGLQNTINKAYLLKDNTPIEVSSSKNGVQLTNLPKIAPHKDISVIALELEGKLNVNPNYIKPQANQTITLTPEKALFTIKPQYDEIPEVVKDSEKTYIGNLKNRYPHPRFKNTANAVHWKVEVDKAGDYKVVANLATDSDENVFNLSADKKIRGTLPNTGGLETFKDVDLGTLKLKKGVNTITFTGGKKQEVWKEVRLGIVTLTPKS